jgi:hypothetical protein
MVFFYFGEGIVRKTGFLGYQKLAGKIGMLKTKQKRYSPFPIPHSQISTNR